MGALAEGCRSIGGGCAEAAERVCDEMDVSGEKDGGAILGVCVSETVFANEAEQIGFRCAVVAKRARNFSGPRAKISVVCVKTHLAHFHYPLRTEPRCNQQEHVIHLLL